MLKTSGNTESSTQPGKGKVGVGGDSKARCNKSELDRSKVDGGELEDKEIGKKV